MTTVTARELQQTRPQPAWLSSFPEDSGFGYSYELLRITRFDLLWDEQPIRYKDENGSEHVVVASEIVDSHTAAAMAVQETMEYNRHRLIDEALTAAKADPGFDLLTDNLKMRAAAEQMLNICLWNGGEI